MHLKRGVERESCDFCHRRKIKCDRSIRANDGYETCSPCEVRLLTCGLDDSNDIRLRKRRQRNTRSDKAGIERRQRPSNFGGGSDDLQTPQHDDATMALSANVITSDSTNGGTLDSSATIGVDPSFPYFATPGTPSYDTLDWSSLDNVFQLSAGASCFLDQIFMADPNLSTSVPQTHALNDGYDAVSATDYQGGNHPDVAESAVGHARYDEFPASCDVEPEAFTNALRAYFTHAILALPIIFEDAFWQDYGAGRASRSLVLAVACRGMPFTGAQNKWDLQQRLARKFREAFLEAQGNATSQDAQRLDDLESLALMTDFAHADPTSSALQANLERLLLTHESLVSMTLQFSRTGSQDGLRSDMDMLARAEERCTLLFWHVYGLDAFRTLDRKAASRISDQEMELTPGVLRHASAGYLDAILALAVIARRVMHKLCTVAVKRTGARPDDVLDLFDQLEDWQRDSCPKHLRWQSRTGEGARATANEGHQRTAATDYQSELRCAVVQALRINCVMQIESVVAEFGIRDDSALNAQVAAARVDYEALRAVHEFADMAPRLRKRQASDDGAAVPPLVDLAPTLRDICAGTCVWTCRRGRDGTQTPSARLGRGNRNAASRKSEISAHQETAQLLRGAVAAATSHRDTAQILQHLDSYLASLDESSYV